RTRSTNSLTTLKLTSASRRASRTSRSPASTSSARSTPRPESFFSAAASRSPRVSNISARLAQEGELALERGDLAAPAPRFGKEAQPLLVLGQRPRGSADDVVDGGPRRAVVIGDLGKRPVLLQIEVQHGRLVLGQQRAV